MSAPLELSRPADTAAIAADAQWRRLSPRMLLIHPVREAGRAIPALIGLVFAGSSSGNGQWWSLGALALVITLSLLRWYTTRYQITPDQVRLRTGLIRRRTVTTPADRVRTVDVTAHALHRLLGLARVVIGTGTSDRKREGLVLDGLTAAAAGGLRAELLHRAAVAVAGDVPAPVDRPAPPEQLIAALDPGWLRFAPFTLSGVLTGLAIAGFGWRIIDQVHVDANRIGVLRSATDYLRRTPVWLDAAQAVAGAVLAITVLSLIGYVLAFWNFRLTRHAGGTLHVARGLITSRATSIEERRLLGAELSEPLLLRSVGGARLLAVATGLRVGRGAERGGTVLLPPSPAAVARRVLGVVLTDPGAADIPLDAHGPRARRRRLNRAVLPWLVVCLGLTGLAAWQMLPVWVAACSAIPLLASVLLGLDRYANLGHALTEVYLVTRFGSLIRRRVLLRTDGIIGWNLRQSFFQRRSGLLTLTATTAAGRQGYRITDLEVAAAVELARRASPELLGQFLVPAAQVTLP